MSSELQHPDSSPKPRPGREWTTDPLAGMSAEERADVEEDRRRQRELDDAELGGEA